MDSADVQKAFDISDEDSRLLVSLAEGETVLEPLDIPERFEATAAWVRRCYSYPSEAELAMSAINELVGGFGVEGIEADGEFVAEYVNTGDTYSTTVVREFGIWGTSGYVLTSWGDWLEAWEAEQKE